MALPMPCQYTTFIQEASSHAIISHTFECWQCEDHICDKANLLFQCCETLALAGCNPYIQICVCVLVNDYVGNQSTNKDQTQDLLLNKCRGYLHWQEKTWCSVFCSSGSGGAGDVGKKGRAVPPSCSAPLPAFIRAHHTNTHQSSDSTAWPLQALLGTGDKSRWQ